MKLLFCGLTLEYSICNLFETQKAHTGRVFVGISTPKGCMWYLVMSLCHTLQLQLVYVMRRAEEFMLVLIAHSMLIHLLGGLQLQVLLLLFGAFLWKHWVWEHTWQQVPMRFCSMQKWHWGVAQPNHCIQLTEGNCGVGHPNQGILVKVFSKHARACHKGWRELPPPCWEIH